MVESDEQTDIIVSHELEQAKRLLESFSRPKRKKKKRQEPVQDQRQETTSSNMVLLPTISEFKLRILAGSASGDNTRVIAKREVYSRDAIEWHILDARQKIGARNIVHAVALLIAHGYLSVPTGPDLRCCPLSTNPSNIPNAMQRL